MPAGMGACYEKIADALGVRRVELKASSRMISSAIFTWRGGVVALPINGARVAFDHRVRDIAVVSCGTGRTTLEIAGDDLVWIAGGEAADVAKS
jgi:hypothetical protein